ncbi:flavin monoamine oxidase family protein [Pseudomonas citronellolis]|uniref:flavin monoamine oxidase family protein n=1 Tax=Pseudomonas citronellolis TaxID=53408 RepID=UPI00209D52A0|nr:FAD-dependent oxidoreductase [Pseudomonas citronellolis]MCP1603598.1 monoamine oxidase [Pseudomonas citronellolis]MCP1653335.1 monoamine oxidase [Pseudomonas citronellolis]MCP1720345.1 monoamine oxidase [Pseudomonas citronellolis]
MRKFISGSSVDLPRRRLLQFAGASIALGGLGLRSEWANASSDENVLDVVIVGAGLAGLTAARSLVQAGCESFLVVEARNRVGGRTLNHDLGNGQISEAGGQWIGPGQTAVADLARELEVGTFPTYYQGKSVYLGGDGRMAVDLKGTLGTDESIGAKLSELSRDVPSGAPWKSPRAAELDKLSVGDWLSHQDLKLEQKVGFEGGVLISGGIMPAKMGLLHFLSMINSANSKYSQLDSIVDSAQETRFIGGSQILSIKMAEQLGDKVRLSSPVRQIENWDKEIVTLRTDTGELRARKVIMAIHPALCQQINFAPQLPAARAALQRAWPGYSPMRKTAMVYSRPFWREKGLNGTLAQIGGPVIWAYDNSPPNGEIGVINAFVRSAWLPSDLDQAERAQARIYAQALGEEALSPVAYYDHDWGKADPWTITCVSAIPPGFWSEHGEALRPPCGNLIWSGTETADIWAGYMDGAVRSGHQSALQVLNALRHVGSPA